MDTNKELLRLLNLAASRVQVNEITYKEDRATITLKSFTCSFKTENAKELIKRLKENINYNHNTYVYRVDGFKLKKQKIC